MGRKMKPNFESNEFKKILDCLVSDEVKVRIKENKCVLCGEDATWFRMGVKEFCVYGLCQRCKEKMTDE